MEHPLIDSIDHLSMEEISAKMSELTRKMNIAAKMGNGHLCNQIRMALETYQNKYQEKLRASYKNNGQDFSDWINIE